MQHSIVFHDDSGILEVTASGWASLEDDVVLIRAILEHPRFEKGLRVLLDQTELAISHLSPQDLREIAGLCAGMSDELGGGRCAILVGTDVDFGIGRMWEAYVDEQVDFRTRVFRTRGEALAWLNGLER